MGTYCKYVLDIDTKDCKYDLFKSVDNVILGNKGMCSLWDVISFCNNCKLTEDKKMMLLDIYPNISLSKCRINNIHNVEELKQIMLDNVPIV